MYKLKELESFNHDIEEQKSTREIFFLSIKAFNELAKNKK